MGNTTLPPSSSELDSRQHKDKKEKHMLMCAQSAVHLLLQPLYNSNACPFGGLHYTLEVFMSALVQKKTLHPDFAIA